MKYFTEDQLAEEIKPLSERALEALNAGQLEILPYFLNQMAIGHAGLCNLGLQWLPRMWSTIARDMGESFLENMLRESTDFLMAPYSSEFKSGNEKEVISELILLYRFQHSASIVPLRETDEEIAIYLSPCGTGGRINLEGWPQLLSEYFSPCSDGTPIYCKACKILQESFNERCGSEIWSTEISNTVNGACEMRFNKQKTKGKKLFDSLEFYELTKPRCRQAIEKLNVGNREISHLLKDQHLEWLPYHDLMVQWAVCTQSVVYNEKGTDYLDQFLKETYDSAFSLAYPAYEALDDITRFRAFVQTWHYHIATFKVKEEEDRFVFILDPCGSGGRLYRSNMHKGQFRYGEGIPCFMDEPANINFNRENFPIYCTHCASSNRDMFEGGPLVFVINGHAMKEPGSPCIHYLYKKGNRDNVPSDLLSQVGKTKVEPLKK
jgi:hypothetical protein